MEQRGGRLRRAGAIGAFAARRVPPVLWESRRRRNGHGSNGSRPPVPPLAQSAAWEQLRVGCENLGATFVKMGQLVASTPGVVGEDVAAVFRPLLDDGPPVPFAEVRAIVEADLGAPLRDLFADFDERPIAAASLAVVHKAVLPDGRPVAVKVLRPGVEELVATDLALARPLVDELAAISAVQMVFLVQGLLDGLAEQLREELDLRNEAVVMHSMRRVLADLDEASVIIPEPIDERSSRRVLTMEFVDGVPIDDLEAVAERGLDVRPLVEALTRSWFLGVMRDGVFHGDVHAGNLLLTPDGRVAVLDWGIVGRLSPDTHAMFRRMLEGVLGDESAWDFVAQNILDRFVTKEHPMFGQVDAAQITPLVRERAHAILMQPFGQVRLSDLLQDGPPLPEEVYAEQWPSPLVLTRRFVARRMGRPLDVKLPPTPDFDRGFFLLMKQLAYFERYGSRYLADRALFDDAALHRAALTIEPL